MHHSVPLSTKTASKHDMMPPSLSQRQVYLRLFRWLVKRVNASTCLPVSEERQDAVLVGVLDICGYVKGKGGETFLVLRNSFLRVELHSPTINTVSAKFLTVPSSARKIEAEEKNSKAAIAGAPHTPLERQTKRNCWQQHIECV